MSTIGSGLNDPEGVALGAGGTVYIADSGNNRVLQETPGNGGYVVKEISSGLNYPTNMKVDAGGNLYVADTFNNRVLKETLSGSSYIETTIGSGLNAPNGVAVDASGNVYIDDTYNSRLLKETPSGGGYTQTVVGSGFSNAGGLAVDAGGNVFIADWGNNRVVKEAVSGSGYISTTVVSGLTHPDSVAVDAGGNLYIADTGANRLVKETVSGNSYTQTTVYSDLNQPEDVAVDASGKIYVADSGNNRLLVLQAGGVDLGTVDIGKSSATVSLTFTMDRAGSLGGTPAVLTQGASGLDFVDAGTGSCTANGASYVYSAGDTCTVNVRFAPKSPGTRYGAVVLRNANAGVLATGYVYGNGTGPQVSFSPGLQSVVASGLFNPRGITADGNGNIYIADTDHNVVLKETFSGGSYSQSTVASTGLLYPIGVAVDGSGNVYVGDCFHGRVLKETPFGGNFAESTVVSGISCPLAIVLDGDGNLYVADGQPRVLKETLSNGSYVQSTIIASGLSEAAGLAMDASGNLYIADFAANKIVKEAYAAGNYVASTIPTSALSSPRQISVDGLGNIFIADAGNNRVLKETAFKTGYVESSISSGLNEPDAVIVGANGNVYIADTKTGRILEENFADAPALGFTATAVGATSSAQTVTLENIGNSPLAFPVPTSGNNPAVSASFTVDGSAANACPQTSAGGAVGPSLAPGASCALAIRFAPTTTGNLHGNIVLGDTHLNAANAMQFIALSGTATAAPANLTLSAPSNAVYGNAVTVSASITNGASQGPVNGGTVAFSDGGSTFGSLAVANGTAAQSYLAPHVGSFTLSGSFTPADGNTTKAQGQTTIQITAAQLTISADDATRAYGAMNPPSSGSIKGAVNGDNFAETFKVNATASSSIGSYPIMPSASGANLSSYTQTVQNGTLKITAASLMATANDATRIYGAADPTFTGSISGQVNGDVLTETFSTTATAASPIANYEIKPGISGAAAGSYNPTLKSGTLTVTPAGLTVTANDAMRTYGAANPSFTGTITGMVNGDDFTESFTTSATAATAVGAYPIVPSAAGPNGGNYTQIATNGMLTITPAALILSAGNATRVYGARNPMLSGSATGLAASDHAQPTFTSDATPSSPVGEYSITPSIAGVALSNYALTVNKGVLLITPATLRLTADEAQRPYGAPNPAFTGALSGAMGADTFTESFSTRATPQSGPGTYAIVPSASGSGMANYTSVPTNGTLTITPAQLTATVANSTRLYGGANPAFTGSVTGAANGEAFTETFTTAATAQSPVGAYTVTPALAGPTLGSYQPVLVPGHMAVVAAPLTVTAANAARPYRAPNPALTGTLVGVVNGDALAASYATPASVTDAPGQYPILVSVSGAALGNYSLAQSNGVLTIEKAASATGLSFDPADGTRLLARVHPALAGVPTGSVRLLNGAQALGEAALVNGNATFAASLVPAGTAATLTAAYEGDGNFLPSASEALALTAAPDFSVAAAPGAPTVATPTAGQAAFLLQATPGDSGVYPGLVTFSVSGLPTGATAVFSPATLEPGSGTRVVTLTVRTGPAPVRSTPGTLSRRVRQRLGGAALAFVMLPMAAARRLRRSRWQLLPMCLLALSAVSGLGALTGCGVTVAKGAGSATVASYPLTITMTSGGMSRTTTATLAIRQ